MYARRCLLATFALASLWVPPVLAKAKHVATPRMTEVPVSVNDAWIREAPPGATTMAAYMLVLNPTKRPLQLTHVTSPAFGEVQMHGVEVKDGLTKMRQVPGFTLGPGARLLFKPGGNHLMLLNPKKALKSGDIVPMVLEFGTNGKDGRRSLQIKVMAQGVTGEAHP